MVPLFSEPELLGIGSALLGARDDFRSLHRLRDRIYNGIYLNFGIKYNIIHEEIGAGSGAEP